MTDELSRLLEAFDGGRLSRRQLLQALGLAVAATPAAALARGLPRSAAGSGAPRATPRPDLPFEPTGWKTISLDHFIAQVWDHQAEAAYYNALMNWDVRSVDQERAVLDMGDVGGIVLRGGYAPPPPSQEEMARYEQMQARLPEARRRPYKPEQAKFTGFAWVIEPWDAKTVEAELKKRGLDPVANHHGAYQSFRVKDPDGFDLQLTNGGGRSGRGPGNATLGAPAPFAHTKWRTVWLDHISYEVPDYKKSVAFYQALLGWKGTTDTGNQNQVQAGDAGDLIIRTFNRPGAPTPMGANIGHISFGIQPFDPDEVKAALEQRGLPAREDTGGRGDIHTAGYKSYHTQTPNGFDLQISSTTKATREPPPAPPRGGRE